MITLAFQFVDKILVKTLLCHFIEKRMAYPRGVDAAFSIPVVLEWQR